MSTKQKKKKRKILFASAIRSEYDILYPVMRAVDNHPKTEANIIVMGAHLTKLFGYTANLVEIDGFNVVGRIESLLNSDTASSRVKSAAIELMGLVDLFVQIKPDIVVAVGDREDSLTISTAGAYMSIPVAHIGGGDTADDGNVDNSVRHAVTKLSHIHLVTTEQSGERVVRLGEEPWRVHVVGAPGLDRYLNTKPLSKKEMSDYLNFDVTKGELLIVIQHSNSIEIGEARRQMETTLEAVSNLGIRTLVSYPNSDAGSHQVIDVINEFSERYEFIKPYKNLSREYFVNLLRHADVLIGNSSCGIIEAPLIKLPVVTVGTRQRKREHAENVIFVEHDVSKIQQAIRTALYDRKFKAEVQRCKNPYGDGHAGERIADILADIEIDQNLIAKRITY